MNNRWIKKFINEGKRIKLTPIEKRAMVTRILGPKSIPSPYSYFLTFMEYRQKIVVAAIMIAFVVTSGGASYVAASALPGEALYQIKVNVNENIEKLVAVSTDAKVKVEVKQTERRIKEAETLSKEGKLNDETKAIIETKIEEHTETIKESIAIIASEGSASTTIAVIEEIKITLSDLASSTSASSSFASTSTSEASTNHLEDLISQVAEAKEEIEVIEKVIEDKELNTTATTTATTTVSTEVDEKEIKVEVESEVKATSTATTTKVI